MLNNIQLHKASAKIIDRLNKKNNNDSSRFSIDNTMDPDKKTARQLKKITN
ncbi:hypothetical protein [Mycoplasma sp. E35C]|uniref:hypothetical protein n=1 Tax=Mycoplasma sp. E35C TaxID=2801918 RepID=UPI001CA39DFC|nr:hypothetical protein [Mycoplasma sp. E35C]